jgi:hypothetical protein
VICAGYLLGVAGVVPTGSRAGLAAAGLTTLCECRGSYSAEAEDSVLPGSGVPTGIILGSLNLR